MLIFLIHLNGKYLGITKRVGPGPPDTASVNPATADVLNEKIFGQHLLDFPAKNLVGRVHHIANLVAKSFLKHEDCVDKPAELPSINVFAPEDENEEWRDSQDESDSENPEEVEMDEEDDTDSCNRSPLYLVKRLAHYVLLSEQRKKVYLAIKAADITLESSLNGGVSLEPFSKSCRICYIFDAAYEVITDEQQDAKQQWIERWTAMTEAITSELEKGTEVDLDSLPRPPATPSI
ncbi:hypothetical protein QFC21_001912 [Naganishia friedmannii]|uniref:Uncharacterized protein n=1 Tax=Naganishia friedmannii TaxID=89922 RepID=A0ACC2W187_9TREE|nr:hypothetical protein QFC21_001912 [Naganishia friedmannii]